MMTGKEFFGDRVECIEIKPEEIESIELCSGSVLLKLNTAVLHISQRRSIASVELVSSSTGRGIAAGIEKRVR